MPTRRTGLQINNRTSLRITSGSITVNNGDVEETELSRFFAGNPGPKENGGVRIYSGTMNILPHKWDQHFVEVYKYPDHHTVTVKLGFENGQAVTFEYPTENVFEDVSHPRWLKSKVSGSSGTPIFPAAAWWTRHDEKITKTYGYGMIILNIDEVPATARWMETNLARLGPLKLSELSLPGTHDTGTWTVTGNPQCHTMDVRHQLNAGIRFLDIRLELLSGLLSDKLEIYHGLQPTGVFFAQILDACQDFLAENPNEAIVMMVSRNAHFIDKVVDIARDILSKFFGTTATDQYFADAVQTVLNKYPGLFLTGTSVPTLNGAKGKIVLANRYPGGPGIALGNGWPDDTTGVFNGGGVAVEVQDVYGYGFLWENVFDDATRLSKIDKKWGFVDTMLQTANNAGRSPGQWIINYTSASGPPGVLNPDQMAKGIGGPNGINDRLLAYLKAHPRGYYGTVPMDFPEYPNNGEIIRRLIDSNL